MATTKEIIEKAYNTEFQSDAALADAIAYEYAYSNMGKSLDEVFYRANPKWLENEPTRIFVTAWRGLCEDCGCEGIDIEDELLYWKKVAPLYVKAIRKAGLPLTVKSAQDVKVKLPKMGKRR
jgi:hypothetical protein